jgi:hypothetical protein
MNLEFIEFIICSLVLLLNNVARRGPLILFACDPPPSPELFALFDILQLLQQQSLSCDGQQFSLSLTGEGDGDSLSLSPFATAMVTLSLVRVLTATVAQ